MVQLVRPANAPEGAETQEPTNTRNSLVDEPVMNEHVADPEERHPRACTDAERKREAMELAPADHEGDRDRRVKERERVVPLEASRPRLVMRAVHVPELMMPDATMEE